MFDYDKWQEILSTIRHNKLRTALTMFGVFWGILMLMLLLGSGQGLSNGMTRDFERVGTNTVMVWGGRTTKPYNGLLAGRSVQFTNDDTIAIKKSVDAIEYISPQIQLGGWSGRLGNTKVTRNNRKGRFIVKGDYPDIRNIMNVDIKNGRFINEIDIKDKRKVAVVGDNIIKSLFRNGENIIGKKIYINGVSFTIVGHHKTLAANGFWSERDNNTIYTPFSTIQQAFNYRNNVGWYAFGAKPKINSNDLEKNIRALLMRRHQIHPQDEAAVGSFNSQEEYEKVQGLLKGIHVFVWFVGLCTLLAGVIGVSNIMMIVVNERTKEIGIRKSMGATPFNIVSLIMQESVFLTGIAGYIGLLLGIALIELMQKVLEALSQNMGLLSRPEINLQAAALALLVIIIGGVFAGILPARKAALISPMEAIRYK